MFNCVFCLEILNHWLKCQDTLIKFNYKTLSHTSDYKVARALYIQEDAHNIISLNNASMLFRPRVSVN